MDALIQLIIFVVLMILGYGFGRWSDYRHYQSIFQREKELRPILIIASKIPPPMIPPPQSTLVSGNVVISIDYFKQFVFGLRMIFGGRVKSYEGLLDRARREAILRMKEQARQHGASMIFNLKVETASISKGAKNTIGSVEVLAYGTALIPRG